MSNKQAHIDHGPANRFKVLSGIKYTVTGKGGLIREIMLPLNLVQQLEKMRLSKSKRVTDRGIYYQQHYQIGGGKAWSNSFSAASKRALGWSHGGTRIASYLCAITNGTIATI